MSSVDNVTAMLRAINLYWRWVEQVELDNRLGKRLRKPSLETIYDLHKRDAFMRGADR